MKIEKLSIIIPAYNEGNTIHLILNKIKATELVHNIQKEVIIVNDCSKDDTEKAITGYQAANPDLNIQYFVNLKNMPLIKPDKKQNSTTPIHWKDT